MPDGRCYVARRSSGLIAYCVGLAQTLRKGDVIACVYEVECPGRAPAAYHPGRGGIVVGRHFPGLVQMGNVVAVIGETVS
jgi:N-alpha-acetyl-L-2,4-diaminobutyrate deacetylase